MWPAYTPENMMSRAVHRMKTLFRPLLVVALFGAFAPSGHASDAPVTIRSLLQEMIDRDRLPQLPALPFIAGQASSYDRASVAPDKPGWFANQDFGMYVRTETNHGRKEHVMMDVDGPGAITRWWEGDIVPMLSSAFTWTGPTNRPSKRTSKNSSAEPGRSSRLWRR